MKNYLSISFIAVVVLSGTTLVNASMLDQVVDGRSFYQDNRAYGGGIIQTVDQVSDSVLVGTYDYPYSGDRTIGSPVLEFEIDSSLSQEDVSIAILNLYLTQSGTDASGNGFTLYYGQGNGIIEYGDTGGTTIGSVDPTTAGWQSVDVSQAVEAAITGSWSWLRLTLEPEQSGDEIYLASSENTGFEPFISVPEPATLCLLSLGSLALIRRRRLA